MDCSPPGFSVHGISQARILEWLPLPPPGNPPDPGIEPMSPALQADSLPLSTWKARPQLLGGCKLKHPLHTSCREKALSTAAAGGLKALPQPEFLPSSSFIS